MKTYSPKSSDVERRWWVIDADGVVLGRLATQIANVLRGKDKPIFSPHVDCGDFVIVVNADKVAVTSDKLTSKLYHRHSGYPGGIRTQTLEQVLRRYPDRVIRTAVEGMLPKNRLSSQVIRKLKVYAGPEHPHEAQKPEVLTVAEKKDPS